MEEEEERFEESKDQGDCWEIVYPSNVRSCTHELSLTRLPKCEPEKDDISRHCKVGGDKPMSSSLLYIKNYR